MIQHFIDNFMAQEHAIKAEWAVQAPGSYGDIVERVVRAVRDEDVYGQPDPARIHRIDDGDYQGTEVYVIAAEGYQPSDYWYVKISYGSCGGCDTFEAIRDSGDWSSDVPTPTQVQDWWTLALHIAQGLTPMQDEGSYV